MGNIVVVRKAQKKDHSFIFELSPYLAEVAQIDWHSDDAMKKMQDAYIAKVLEETPIPNGTFIAEIDNVSLGFIHVRTYEDGISGETCGTIPLLAVLPKSQGLGIG